MLILSDFSKTWTRSDMPTTWSVFARSGLLGDDYTADRNRLYAEYHHFEEAGNVEMTEQWFIDHLHLFVKYGLTQDLIDQIVQDDTYFAPREGVQEFLDSLRHDDIPLVIVTSGVADFVRAWFRLRYDYTPEIILGNELILTDGVVTGVLEESVICPLDKSIDAEEEESGETVDDIILLGDSREDLTITRNIKKSIGFTDAAQGFDIALGRDASMEEIMIHLV